MAYPTAEAAIPTQTEDIDVAFQAQELEQARLEARLLQTDDVMDKAQILVKLGLAPGIVEAMDSLTQDARHRFED